MIPAGKPCGPFDCHPAYDNQAKQIRHYLAKRSHVVVPYAQRPIFASFDPAPISDTTFKTHTITRYKASGPAPWAGSPFVYWWYVGADEFGRQIGDGEPARLHQIDGLANPRDMDDYSYHYGLWQSAVHARRLGIYAG